MASQLIEEVTAHAQRDSLEDAREICADGAYFTNNLRIFEKKILDIKCAFRFSVQSSSEIFLILRGFQLDTVINVHRASRNVPVILVTF